MTRHVRSWVLAALAVFVLAGAATPLFAGIVLSSNMNESNTNYTLISNTNWIAARFRTTSVLTTITDVNLDVHDEGEYSSGNLSVEIWTASDAGPIAFMQSIQSSSFSSTPVSITGLSVMLQPNTDYAVVARGNVFDTSQGGYLNWNFTNTTTHTGDGFVSGRWRSSNSGASWTSSSTTTQKMSVFAAHSAVPEIDPATGGTAISLITGVLAVIEQRRAGFE